ncbi:MAG: efflux transporter outer membrane subunit [Alphaproteobacteria bacterium]
MLRIEHTISLAVLALALSSCVSVPEFRLADTFKLERNYKAAEDIQSLREQQAETDLETDEVWWKSYNDNELNALIEIALIQSPDINKIQARLEQAQALETRSKSSRLPSLNINGDRSTSNGDNETPSDWSFGGTASFELDIWGKNRANHKSSITESEASALDVQSAEITLSASIVNKWLEILSLIEQEKLVRNQIDVNRTVLNLQEKRFEMGSASALDILQQEERLAQSQTQLPDLISAQKQAANAIALLLGETPYNGLKITEKPFPKPLVVPQTGLPSDLLGNRPDIRAAWLRMRSAEWATKAAWADRLPNFTLSSAYTTSATKLDSLFSSWLVNTVLGFTAPVFDGQSRKAEQIRQAAITDERFQDYRGVVLQAVIDVEDSLIRNAYQDRKIIALEKQLNVSQRTLEQAQLSYANGDSTYINVLNSLNNTQSLEQQLLNEKLVQAQERVGLYRTLGGHYPMQRMQAQNLQGEPQNIDGSKDNHEEH